MPTTGTQGLTVTKSNGDTNQVVAGGRPLTARKALHKSKKLPAELQSIPCIVRHETEGGELSLAEKCLSLLVATSWRTIPLA